MAASAPLMSLTTSGRREQGAFAVTDATGALIASIRRSWFGGSFLVLDPDGALLCRGHRDRPSRTSTAVDPSGAVVLRVTAARGRRRFVDLPDGRRGLYERPALQLEWSVSVDGDYLAYGGPDEPAHRFATPDERVWVPDGQLTLTQATALPELLRIVPTPVDTDVGVGSSDP